ncbi:cytosine deaminase [Streptomyces sp. Ru71]|uniref:amidohydrolase n=1 Tax=Streptomyces sp. Ru71 TaxID=2080746 RepID=UPI000CDD2A21|nr:amidohydrolase [Streptomyces sp. Ru71]POX48527.1 cytosine deaminase [Streptomyces sp. Ru71]
MSHALFTRIRPHGGDPHDLLVTDGRVAAVDPRTRPDDCVVVDGGGALALPSPVDAHIHPDKSAWGGPWLSREPAGSLRELIAADVAAQREMAASVRERAGALIARAAGRGTRAMRAHADVSPVHGLTHVHGVRAAAAAVAPAMELQVVAFPQLGLLTEPGTADLLEQAVKEGADVVGGLDPVGVDGDLEGHLDVLFGIAERTGAPIDIHLHDRDRAGLRQIAEIARRTRAADMRGRVTISHAFCLSDCDAAELERVADLLADADVAVITCALGGEPVVPLWPLVERGVRVAVGSDGVRDAWTPFGDGDMVRRAHLLAYRTDARTDEELQACYAVAAHGGADVLGLERAGLRVGDPADFLLMPGDSVAQVLVDLPTPAMVVRAGNVVARDGRLQGGAG